MCNYVVFLYFYAFKKVLKTNFLITKMTIQPSVVKKMMEKGMFPDTSNFEELERILYIENDGVLGGYGDYIFSDIRVKEDFSISFSCDFFQNYSFYIAVREIENFIPHILSINNMREWKNNLYKEYLKFRLIARFGNFFDIVNEYYDDIYESVLRAASYNYLDVLNEGTNHLLLLKDLFDSEEE